MSLVLLSLPTRSAQARLRPYRRTHHNSLELQIRFITAVLATAAAANPARASARSPTEGRFPSAAVRCRRASARRHGTAAATVELGMPPQLLSPHLAAIRATMGKLSANHCGADRLEPK